MPTCESCSPAAQGCEYLGARPAPQSEPILRTTASNASFTNPSQRQLILGWSMAATTSGTNDDAGETGPQAGARQLTAAPAASVGDRCAVCQASLAGDQRYCVECGERRAKPNFPLPQTAADSNEDRARHRRQARRPRVSSGATLVAGVGTLLLAMGVGVLIGHNGNNSAPTTHASSPAVQVVTVGGAGGGAARAAKPATVSPRSTKSKSHSQSTASAKHKQAPSAPPKAVAAKANAAASKVLGGSRKDAPPPTVTVGQTGHGAGYQNGHFTGNFFGH